jgi:hypothetical protein
MAKNFYSWKIVFKRLILDNVIENFTDFPDVISEAKKLDAIKTEESKTNSSIVK